MNYHHYEQLFEVEKKSDIRVVPNLTEYHVKPQRLQSMNVRLATQVFCFAHPPLILINVTSLASLLAISKQIFIDTLHISAMSLQSRLIDLHSWHPAS